MAGIAGNFMSQFTSFWAKLERNQRLVLVGGGSLIALMLVLFIVWAAQPDYAVAFTGLTEGDAGAVAQHLKEQSIDYQVQADGTILVPRSQVFDTRIDVASKGLLQESTVGYELFDTTSALGMTEFNQKVTYQRALEGELARTIEALDAVALARVHITLPEDALFKDQQKEPTAAITLKLEPRQKLSDEQVSAIKGLASSSVQGLKPKDVVIVDMAGNMLSGLLLDDVAKSSADTNSDKMTAERKYEEQIETNVQAMLVRALGPDRSVVRVKARLGWDAVEIVEQNFFPDSVVRSEQVTTESYTGTGEFVGGSPGAGSNLPSDQGIPSYQAMKDTGTNIDYAHTETTTNYEMGSVEEKRKVAGGQLQQLSVSVVVDNVTDEDMLDSLKEVAARAAGVNIERGDQFTLQSIPFDRTFFQEETADFENQQLGQTYRQVAQWFGVAVVLLSALWFTQRLVRNLRLKAEERDVWDNMRLGVDTETGGGSGLLQASVPMMPMALPDDEEDRLPTQDSSRARRAVQRIAEQRPMTVAEIIRQWMEQDKDPSAA
ncbi:flagellar M-ring protein [Anaerolineaceae bacterium]|nr:flagellar M-ring protein [Anaerolineaceae bacterium]GBL38092.1 flagellar M-ring protein [Anaerolineaceae bacterium]